MIKISVIMPVYNSEKYLRKSIETVLNQSLKEMELILIDDGSSDRSGEICDEYAQGDERVKVVHQENKGLSAARNVGLKLVQGEYITFADNDDECLPGFLEKNYAIAKKYDADMVKFGRESVIVDKNDEVYGKSVRNLEEHYYTRKQILKNYFKLREQNIFSPVWDGLYRSTMVFDNHITFPEELRYGEEDTIFCLKCVEVMQSLATNSGVYFKHFFRKKHSQSSKFHELTLDKLISSAVVEKQVLNNLETEISKCDYVLNNAKYQLIEIFLQLYHPDCDYSMARKKEYLNKVRTYSEFQYDLKWDDYKILFKRDKKKTIMIWLFEHKYDTLLLAITKVYKKMIDKKLRKQ